MDSIGRYCAAVYRLSQSIFKHELKELGISSGQYDFFLVIERNEGISQKEICERLYVEKSTTAKAVKYLASKGLICNRLVKDDKRLSSLYLTGKGRAAAERIETVFSGILGIYSENIPDCEIERTISTLKKVIANLQEKKSGFAGG